MKRLTLIMCIIICMFLFSCGKSDYTVNAEEKEPIGSVYASGTLYVVNTSTRSYHLPSCYILKNTKEENKKETYDIEFLTERGYTPCKICISSSN